MNPNKRLLSLDVLRGITVAGMILHTPSGMVFRQPIWYSRCLCS